MKPPIAGTRSFPRPRRDTTGCGKASRSSEPPDTLVVTGGLAAAFPDDLPSILTKVKEFSTFTEDNDPWHEHDFGAFEYKGEKMFWKIDDHRGNEGYNLVLTVMLASDY